MDPTDAMKHRRKPGDPASGTPGESPTVVEESERSRAQRANLAHLFEDDGSDEKRRRRGGRRRKAKRGSSRPARRLEDIERRISKAMRRVTKAVNRGMAEYQDQRDKSGSKRRDGALVDIYENVSRGLSRAVSESSPLLVDLSKAFNTKRNRRRIRKSLRGWPRIPFLV
jgi:hypothetical protein